MPRPVAYSADPLHWQPTAVAVGYGAEVAGRGALDNRIARTIAHAMREAREERGLKRADIAQQMSAFLGRTISEAMLNKWSSEGSEDHRIPLDAFMALVDATGAQQLLGFVPAQFGMVVIDKRHADLVRMHLIREKVQELQAEERALMAQWQVQS